jgi:Flp pilus assembly protein TadG
MVRRSWIASRLRRFPRLAAAIRRSRWLSDEAGVSAVEFALLLPFMLTLFFGGVELTEALTIDRKVTHVTSTLADLVTQSKTITSTDMTNILDAAAAVISPYSASGLKMVISQVKIDANGSATVDWSQARNTTALTKGSSVTLPSAVKDKNTYLIMSSAHYAYTPAIGYVITGTLDLHDQFYLKPRISSVIACCS